MSETTRPTTQSTPPATEPASEPTDSTTKPTNSTAECTDPTIERIHSTAGPTVEYTEFDATNEPPKALAGASVPALHENQSMNINSSTMFPSGITAQPNSESDDDKTSHEVMGVRLITQTHLPVLRRTHTLLSLHLTKPLQQKLLKPMQTLLEQRSTCQV